MTTVTVPASVVPAAAPATGTARRDGIASAGEVTGDDRFDRHLERAVRDVRDGRPVGVAHSDSARPSDDDASAPADGASAADAGPRADATPGDDEPRAEGDAPVAVLPAALALASRSDVAEPVATTTEPAATTTEPAATTSAVVGSPSGADVTATDVDAPAEATAALAPDAPVATTAPEPTATAPNATAPNATAPTDAAAALDGVEIEVHTPASSALISTAGRAALHARATAADPTGDLATPATIAATAAPAATSAGADGAAGPDTGPTADTIASPTGLPVPTDAKRPAFAAAASDAAVAVAVAPSTALPEKPELRGSLSLPSISVDLSDEGLGPMQLQARQGADGLHLTITAADREVGAALARAGAELRRDLEAAGTLVGSLDIGQGGSGGRRQGAESDAPSRQAGRVSPLATALSSSAGRTPLTTPTRTSPADAGLDLLI